ncbi:sensor histidine kinase [Plantactinospora sp. CA-290183]|uniref:sensor histidine kinase n=1 Tax=Plantactinospora sp. CA-290183 TaxID=3240006 RepID=UPI003D8E44D0
MENATAGRLHGVLADLGRLLAGPDYPPAPPVGPPGRWRRWWRRGQPYLTPLLLLALIGLTVAASQYLVDERGTRQFVALLLGAGSTLPPALAPRRPLLAWRVSYPMLFLGALGTTPSEGWPWNPVQIFGFIFLLFLLAARADSGVAAWAGLFSLLPLYLLMPHPENAHGVTVLFAVTVILGDQVRRRRQSQRALAEQAERSELEQARRAVLEERTRIAREMHDVVAHHMSMIAVQAETAPYRLAALPDPARSEFSAIAGAAREALADMRRLLGVLRSEPAAPQTSPQPGLAEVPELVEAARRAGMSVTFGGLPATDAGTTAPVGLAAYRIIQEALANAARHAPGGAVRVALRGDERALTVTVDNGPASAGPPAGTGRGEGHGLTGMRERARLLGGTLTAGPTEQGYAVTAHLPHRTEETIS